MSRGTALLAAALLALVPLLPRPAAARDLAVATLERQGAAAITDTLLHPFTSTAGTKLAIDHWDGDLSALRSHLGDGADAWDVVQMPAAQLQPACDQGLLEKLDWARIGGKDRTIAQGVSDCGMGAAVTSMALAWDRQKVQGTPTWGDFWDVVKYPGKRGLRKGVRGNLEIALLADGVSPGDVYRVLRSSDGVDRAFRKLDQLKPYIVWWQAEGEATRLLGTGEVLMTAAFSTAVWAADHRQHRDFGLQWAASLYSVDGWAITKGSPNLDAAYSFLGFAGDAKQQQALLAASGLGGTAKGLNDGLDPAVLAASPTQADRLAGALQIDQAFWRDNHDKLTARFNQWLAAH